MTYSEGKFYPIVHCAPVLGDYDASYDNNDDMKMRVYIYLCVYAIVIKTTK